MGSALYFGGAKTAKCPVCTRKLYPDEITGSGCTFFFFKEVGGKNKLWLDSKYQMGQNSSLWWLFLVVVTAAKPEPTIYDSEIHEREII